MWRVTPLYFVGSTAPVRVWWPDGRLSCVQCGVYVTAFMSSSFPTSKPRALLISTTVQGASSRSEGKSAPAGAWQPATAHRDRNMRRSSARAPRGAAQRGCRRCGGRRRRRGRRFGGRRRHPCCALCGPLSAGRPANEHFVHLMQPASRRPRQAESRGGSPLCVGGGSQASPRLARGAVATRWRGSTRRLCKGQRAAAAALRLPQLRHERLRSPSAGPAARSPKLGPVS